MTIETKKMVLHLFAGYAGTDSTEFYNVPVDMSQEELDDYAWQSALQHAESFGNYPESERPDDHDEENESSRDDHYTDDIQGYFEDYNPEEHDGLRVGRDDSWTDI